MSILSYKFIIFLVGMLGLYWVGNSLSKKIILLLANLLFYYTFGVKNLGILILGILISFYGTKLIRKYKSVKLEVLLIIISLIPLIGFKYSNFMISNVNKIVGDILGLNVSINSLSLVLPLGISFYTFKVISFIVDDFKGKIEAEYNLLDYAIYVSFFPAISSGPIDKPNEFLGQIHQMPKFDWDRFVSGFVLVVFGYFQKMVLADRLSYVVNNVFGSYQSYDGLALFFTSILYSLQIYLDFAGYSCIAIGFARLMGIKCMDNFKQPYFSKNIKEFWRRWHISLSTWLRDYIYIPLGGNRKGRFRKQINVLVTFLVSGLWHGAGWGFIIWGGLHGTYQIVGDLTQKNREKYNGLIN